VLGRLGRLFGPEQPVQCSGELAGPVLTGDHQVSETATVARSSDSHERGKPGPRKGIVPDQQQQLMTHVLQPVDQRGRAQQESPAPQAETGEHIVAASLGIAKALAFIDEHRPCRGVGGPAAAQELVRMQEKAEPNPLARGFPLRQERCGCQDLDRPSRLESSGDRKADEGLTRTDWIGQQRPAITPHGREGPGKGQPLIAAKPPRRDIARFGRQQGADQLRRELLRRHPRPRPEPLSQRIAHRDERFSDERGSLSEPTRPAQRVPR
jgi:hypothetical protein